MMFNFNKDISELESVMGKMSLFCELNNISNDVLYNLKIVIDEIVSNIIYYSEFANGNNKITISIIIKNNGIRLKIIDSGNGFNPLSLKDPDVSSDIDERKIGGLGVYLVRQISRGIKYNRKNGKNVLTVNISIR